MISKPSDLKGKNIGRVIQLLLAKPDTPRVELARQTELTKTTISSIVASLIDLGIAEELSGEKTGLVGKAPIPVRIRSDAATVIGVNLARGGTTGVAMSASGKPLASSVKSVANKTRADATANLFDVVQRLINKCYRNEIRVDAIGIGAPSPLDKEKGMIYSPFGLSDWRDFAIGEITEKRFGLPVFIVNDGDGAAFGMKCFGKCRDISSFISLYFDEGIGAGIILKDEIYSGSFGYSGEISYALLKSFCDEPIDKSSLSLDTIVSALNSELGENLGSIDDFLCKGSVFSRRMASVIGRVGDELGRIAALVSNIFGPEAVVVNGKLLDFGDVFFEALRTSFESSLFSGDQVRLIGGNSDQFEAFSTGAASYAIFSYLMSKALTD